MIKKLFFEIEEGKFYILYAKSGTRGNEGFNKGDCWSYFVGKKYIWHDGYGKRAYKKTQWKTRKELLSWILNKVSVLDIYQADNRKEAKNCEDSLKLVEKLRK